MLTGRQQTFSEDPKDRSEAKGDHRRHVERFADAGVASLAKSGTTMNRSSRTPLARREPGKSRNSFGGLEAIEMRDLREDGSSRGLADSRNRRQEVAPALKIGMIVEVPTDLALDLRDLLIERSKDFSNGSRDDGRFRGLCVDRLLCSGGLQVIVMAHKSL